MKIGLITIHYANSYGGVLQAFSTQIILSKFGDVAILDYRSKHLDNSMKTIRLSRNPRSLLWMVKDVARFFPRYRLIKKFKSFVLKYYNLTDKYGDIDEMFGLDDQFDVFVTGSDQIWNPNIVGGLDSVYMLGFVNKKRKISFASSAGSYCFSRKEEAVVRGRLEVFSSLSVRESNTANYLTKLLEGKPVSHVLDPTLMLSRQEWLGALDIPEYNGDKFILVYTLKKSRLVREVVKNISKRLGLRVVSIDQDPFLGYPVDEHIMDASPRDYVKLISQASMVITNSFHGTAFSVNFAVPFISITPETGLNRIADFLSSVGLSERLIKNTKDIEDVLSLPLSFESVHQRLNELRRCSFDFLDQAFKE